MRTLLLSMGLALALAACGREESPRPSQDPLAGAPPPAPVEQARQAEQSAGQDKPLSSTSLAQIVRSALESESSLDARRIDIENRDGTIELHGQVDSEEQREKAGRIVGSVGGVTGVDNQLTVSPSASAGPSGGSGDILDRPKDTLELPK